VYSDLVLARVTSTWHSSASTWTSSTSTPKTVLKYEYNTPVLVSSNFAKSFLPKGWQK